MRADERRLRQETTDNHEAFGLIQSKRMNVIDSKKLSML